MPMWAATNFQDRCSPIIEQLSFFHDHRIIILMVVTTLSVYLILRIISGDMFDLMLLEAQGVETVWTVLPVFLLVFIAIPSLKVLYLMDEFQPPSLTVKAIGHQWYWRYEYSDVSGVEFDSYMSAPHESIYRLLERGDPLYLPTFSSIRVLVSSFDVIHSWALPRMGVRVDALPGRLNQLFLMRKRVGFFTGQCREICGANHSFIPILVGTVPAKMFREWVASNNR